MLPTNYISAFKAYDIRGLRESQINETFAYILGVSIGSDANHRNIIIACDTRPENTMLMDHLMTGLNTHGVKITVVNLQPESLSPTGQELGYGTCSSSTLYQLTTQYDLGIVVSASHNPTGYVGFKVVKSDLAFIPTSLLQQQFEITLSTLGTQPSYTINTNHTKITDQQIIQAKELVDPYFENIKSGLTIALDYSNGAAITYERDYLYAWADRAGHTLIEMNIGADGTFTSHGSDTQEDYNYQQLITAVLGDQADIGILFDGDADRIGVVSSSGQIIPGDLVLGLIVQQLGVTGEQIIFDAMSGNSIRRAIIGSGNIPVVCKMGRFFINEKIHQTGAILGGEISGHIMFGSQGGAECVLIAIAYLLSSLSTATIDEQVVKLTTGIYREPMLNLHVERKDEILAALMEHFADLSPLQIDGVNIYSDTMCLTARKSNTEPIIRIQLETSSKAEFQQIIGEVKEIIERIEG